MSFGFREIFIILVVVLIIFVFFGANKIPEFARGLRKGIDEFKKAGNEFTKTVEGKGKETDKKE